MPAKLAANQSSSSQSHLHFARDGREEKEKNRILALGLLQPPFGRRAYIVLYLHTLGKIFAIDWEG